MNSGLLNDDTTERFKPGHIWINKNQTKQVFLSVRMLSAAKASGLFVNTALSPLWSSDKLQYKNAFRCLKIWACIRQNQPKWPEHPAKTLISLAIRPVWSESSLSTLTIIGSLVTHKAHTKTLIRLGRCPCWSEFSQGAQLFCLFCRAAAHLYSCNEKQGF